jgi:hypothetical protein
MTRRRITIAGLAVSVVAAASSAHPWSDNFDSHVTGTLAVAAVHVISNARLVFDDDRTVVTATVPAVYNRESSRAIGVSE